MFPIQQVQLPNISQVPPPLRMDEPTSFAHYTFKKRWPAVITRVNQENQYAGPIAKRLRQLQGELHHGVVRSLEDEAAPDWAVWEQDIAPYRDLPWLELPWLFAEFYLYRRILEAVDYFEADGLNGASDPFAPQKQVALDEAVPSAELPLDISRSLYGALWGNRADLSLRPEASWSQAGGEALTEQILVDDSGAVVRYLQFRPEGVVDIVTDNAGAELLADLALAASLLSSPGRQVRLHLKAYPTFVSDATRQDFDHTLKAIAGSPLAAFLASSLSAGRLQVLDDPLWNRPLGFWQMNTLADLFAQSQLVILKGDANYRRLLGDCQWPPTTSFAAMASYFPAPVVALRTLKCELVVGMAAEPLETMSNTAPDWMTSGEWGLVQGRL